MRVQVRRPGRAAKAAGADLRTSVTFTDDSLPTTLSVHMVVIGDDETGERDLRAVGIELGSELRDEAAALQAPELTPLALRRVVERYPHWVELARAHASVDFGRAGEEASRVKRVKPARIDDDWLRMIASEYGHHVDDGDPAPISAIAKSHQVSVSAASRWVKAARAKSMLAGQG